LNFHRRHNATVTEAIEKDERAIGEAVRVKAQIIEEFDLSPNQLCRTAAATIYEYHRGAAA
jgi:hypothetical protein